MEILENYSLKDLNSWRVGGKAEYICFPKQMENVVEAVRWAQTQKQPISILGDGTNVLISEDGVEGLLICTKDLSGLQSRVESQRLIIECLAGTPKAEVLKVFLKNRLAPAMFLAGLPGNVGGGIKMNAGVGHNMQPKEFVEITDWFEVVAFSRNTEVRKFTNKDIQWKYRQTQGWQPGIIVRACLSWPMQPDDRILKQVREANKRRMESQPLDQPSCGSTFVNPPGKKSGQLIEMCGLKGERIGDAEVSTKHANFLINKGEARAGDIHRLIRHIQQEVKNKTGIELQSEVVYLGRW